MVQLYDKPNNVKIDIIDDSSADEQIQIMADTKAIEATAREESSITDLATGPTPLASSSADNSSEVAEPADNFTEVAEDHDEDNEETAENTATMLVEVQISDDEEDDEDYVEGQSELIAAEEDDGESQEAISLLVEENDEADEDDEVSLSVIEKECVDLLTDMQDGEVNFQAFSDITEVISEIRQKVESKQLEAINNEADVTPLEENENQSRKRSRDEVDDDEEEDEKSDDNDEEPTQKKQVTSTLRGFTKFALGTIVGSALTIVTLIATSPTNQ
ncbi:hypothetical protein D0Z03_001635 [Geotrichum reessii]|nr:hypothetical protein D0Z03_001635 [Galactomyces reessii]